MTPRPATNFYLPLVTAKNGKITLSQQYAMEEKGQESKRRQKGTKQLIIRKGRLQPSEPKDRNPGLRSLALLNLYQKPKEYQQRALVFLCLKATFGLSWHISEIKKRRKGVSCNIPWVLISLVVEEPNDQIYKIIYPFTNKVSNHLSSISVPTCFICRSMCTNASRLSFQRTISSWFHAMCCRSRRHDLQTKS